MEDKDDEDENTTIVAETPPEGLESEKTPDNNAAESVLGIMMMFLDGEVRSFFISVLKKKMSKGETPPKIRH